MTNERLEEIKDSIDFQLQCTKIKEYDDTFIKEEKELYDEVVRLRIEVSARETIALKLQDRIDKAIEFIEEELTFYITIGGTDERKLIGYNKAFDELLDILQGSDKNV